MADNKKGVLTAADIKGFDVEGLLKQLGYLKGPKAPPATGRGQFRAFDDRTIAQLQEQRFSGIRSNEIWNRFEIWVAGDIRKTISYQEFFLNPNRLNLAFCEVFGLDEINFDAKTQRDIAKLEERKAMLSEPEIQEAANKLEEKPKDG